MRRKDLALIPSLQTVYDKGKCRISDTFRCVLRFTVLLCAVIGMNILINGMLGLKAEPAVIILTACYAFSGFYLLFRSVKGLISGAAILVFGMLVILLCTGLSPKDIFVGGFIGIVNSVIDTVSSLGYVTIGKLSYDGASDVGVFTMASIITSVIVSLSCRKKTHVLPLIFVSAAICSAYAMFGGQMPISDVALLLCTISAMAAMSVSDYRTDTHGRSAFAGLTAFILAMAILLSPAANVKAPMDQHRFFADIYADIINYYNSLYDGGAVGRFSDIHDASASRRRYFDIEIMTVYSDCSSPIYLRTWAGGLFENDSWRVVKNEVTADTDPYNVATNFTSAANGIGVSMADLGLMNEAVVIELKRRHDTLPVPAITGRIPTRHFPSKDTGYNVNKYDGIVSLSSPYKGKYTINSLTCASSNEGFTEFLYGYLQYMKGYAYTGGMPSDASDVAWRLRNRYGTSLFKCFNTMRNLNYFAKSNYYHYENDPYIEAAISEIFSRYDIEEYYTETDYIPIGGAYQNGVISGNGRYYVLEDYGTAHVTDIINIVADYFSQKCKYDTNPKKTGAKSVTEELLFGSNEGYCVQFATVGALIMRRLGFPTRYAEGYIARDFKANRGSHQKDGAYRCTVVDRNAHAWSEVWVDGFGWMPAEFTPGYGGGNNVTPPPETSSDAPETSEPITTPESSSDIIDITETSGGETSAEDTDTAPVGTSRPESETTAGILPDGNGEEHGLPTFWIVTVAAVVILIALAAVSISRADKNKKRLTRLIERGLRPSALNSAEKERIGELLTDALARAFNAYGVLPKAGELPEDFGKRLDESLQLKGLDIPLSACVEAMSKQIYKGIMEEGEVISAALTLQALSGNAPIKLGLFKFLRYRLKGVI